MVYASNDPKLTVIRRTGDEGPMTTDTHTHTSWKLPLKNFRKYMHIDIFFIKV